MTFLITSASEMTGSLAYSGICLSTRGVRTKPGQMTLTAHFVLGAFLGDDLGEPDQPVLGGHVGAP